MPQKTATVEEVLNREFCSTVRSMASAPRILNPSRSPWSYHSILRASFHALVCFFCVLYSCLAADDLASIPADLITPPATDGTPSPGKRVRQFRNEHGPSSSRVHHLLYLPTDWVRGKTFPVIVEYAGNKWQTSPGTVEGSNLGYGISGGQGAIWICMPFVDEQHQTNAENWWGDTAATVAYCKRTVREVCEQYGGDRANVFLAGFSRGAIACNYIGLHDDEIASLWRGFICHSHYEGVRPWPQSTPDGAAERLKRLRQRPQFISHETIAPRESVEPTREYLAKAQPDGNFTFLALPFETHTDTWVLRDIPARQALRDWFRAARVTTDK